MSTIRTVAPGDCLSSIGFEQGFAPDTLWQHPSNQALHAAGRKPNQLLPGDEVFIPDLRERHVEVETGARHRFRRRGVPSLFQVRFVDSEGRPRANIGYTLTVDGVAKDGATDAEGAIRTWVSPAARKAVLILRAPDGDEVYDIGLGRMSPISAVAGVKARLAALGYPCEIDELENDALATVLQRFQADEGLPVNGERDGATLAKLEERYGS